MMVKLNFNKRVSKKLNDNLNEYHANVKQAGKPRSAFINSGLNISLQLHTTPYANKDIELQIDQTANYMQVIDHTNNISHMYTKDFSQNLDDANLQTIEKIEAKLMQDINAVLEGHQQSQPPEEVKWNHSDISINIDGSMGVFLELGEPREHDFLPALLTSQECVLCADAVLGIGGSYEMGGRALMFINTKYARKGKRLREKGLA